MKLIMTLLVRDEVDIVRENIEFHLARGIDAIVAVDNGSEDGTRDILEEYVRAGVAVVFDEPGRDYAQSKWVTRAALYARDELAADWIINNDADEFWTAPGTTLKELAETVGAPQLRCARLNMLCGHDDPWEGDWAARLIHRVARPRPFAIPADIYDTPLSDPFFYLALPPKVMVSARGLAQVGQGNHSAKFDTPAAIRDAPVEIFHFPLRSRAQFERKIVQGGRAYAANKELPEQVGWTWRRWYRLYCTQGLDAVLADALPSRRQLNRDIDAGETVEDYRFRNLVSDLSRAPAQ